MNIGIEQNFKLIYEATSTLGYPVWPSPVLYQVVIASEKDETYTAAKPNDLQPYSLLFREDTYNTSSRIRRGRLYEAGQGQPVQWQVFPHPAIANEVAKADWTAGKLDKQVYAFSSFRLKPYLEAKKYKRPIFILGADTGFTIWSLVNIETSATGEEIVVLRGRKSIGALPNLDRDKILQADGQTVIQKIETLEEELYRAGPDSVIDRSRDAATAIISKYLQSIGVDVKDLDLAKLAAKAADAKKYVVSNCAHILALLHSRGKHVEQEKRAVRPNTEQDAEFAVQAVGLILCDFGWGTFNY